MQISTNAVLALSPTAGFGSCIINLELEIVSHPSHIFNATTNITVCSSIGTLLLSLYGPLAAVNCYRTTTARKKTPPRFVVQNTPPTRKPQPHKHKRTIRWGPYSPFLLRSSISCCHSRDPARRCRKTSFIQPSYAEHYISPHK